MSVILLSCIGTDANISNPNLLYHFIKYYQELGIENWAITLHVGINKTLNNLGVFEEILNSYRVPYEVWIEEFYTHKRDTKHNRFVAEQKETDWFFGVDLDEFVEFPCSIPDYLNSLTEQGYNCLCGRLIDRIDSQGILINIEKDVPLNEQFPLSAKVKNNIYRPTMPKAPFEKRLAIKKPLQWGLGRHGIAYDYSIYQNEHPEILAINHYAWDSLLVGRIQQRVDSYKKYEGFDWGQEYINMINYIAKHKKLRLEDIQ